MDASNTTTDCFECPGRLVCRCLQVTEEAVVSAIEFGGCQSVRDLRRETGAGSGCTACQRQLRVILERRASLTVLQTA
jgi:bacterioferritin-associated ferredoxin